MPGSILRSAMYCVLALLGALSLPATGLGDGLPGVDPAVAAAIRSTWSGVDASWNARDVTPFSLFFTEDASFGNVPEGRSLEGRAGIRSYFEKQFPKYAPELRHVTQLHEFRSIAPNVVAAEGFVEIHGNAGAQSTTIRRIAIFAIMLHASDGWKVHVLRAYRLAEQAT